MASATPTPAGRESMCDIGWRERMRRLWWQVRSRLNLMIVFAVVLTLWAVSFGHKLGMMRVPEMMTILMDVPDSIPQDKPKTFTEALNHASGVLLVDYKHLLCIRLCELGVKGNEMGITSRSFLIDRQFPEFTQAYHAARIISLRQREFCGSKQIQNRWNKYYDPFIAYCCYRWLPQAWKKYYCNMDTKHGVSYYYRTMTIEKLEKVIAKKEKEINAESK